MSWSGYATAQYPDAEDAIANLAVSPDSTAPEQVEQVNAAKAAATELVKSGVVVNDPSQDVTISISGHANPGHKVTPGYGNDLVTVSISQVARTSADA